MSRPLKQWPRLTERQLAVLACVRDKDVMPKRVTIGWGTFTLYMAHGFNVTGQINSLKKRRLIRFDERLRVGIRFACSDEGIDVLQQHPEF